MKPIFSRNIDGKGRMIRFLGAVGLLVGAGFAYSYSGWLALTLAISGAFVMFEALRGWCALRACGIKTKF